MIYLDNNATTPIDPAVRDVIAPVLAEQFGNPSSSHVLGRTARQAIDDARLQIGRLVSGDADEIIFTSGGTESSNLAILGTAYNSAPDFSGHVVISAIEHPATTEPMRFLQRLGMDLTVVGCDARAVVDPQDISDAIRPDTKLVSVMHANNEVGSIQPIAEVSEVCRRANVAFHVDAAQTIGKLDVNVKEMGVDLLTIAGHKFYGPKGVGALYIRKGVRLQPVLRGASHERGLRPGTENTPYIVALGKAAEIAAADLTNEGRRLADLRDRLASQLKICTELDLAFNGEGAERLPNTLSVNFPDVSAADLLSDIPHLCASTGAACHSGSTRVSSTLAAMGLEPDLARGTVRLSVGRFTTMAEVDEAASLLATSWRKLRE